MADIHYYESTVERRARLGSKTCHGQALCGNGNAHQQTTRTTSRVTCEACLVRLKRCKDG